MPYIRQINENEAEGKLKEYYESLIKSRGKLSNIMKIHSLNPGSMMAHMDLYLKIMFGKTALKREENELIAVVVSSANKCDYCINHHSEALNFYWKDSDRIKLAVEDYTKAELNQKQTKMVEYAIKLTKNPYNVSEEDILELRNAGLTDEEILNVNLVTSYFNFVNRIALGLGVEFNEDEVKGFKY
ncbi:MAG: peroxidase-related enzyme [Bacteroidetes bacterium]|nr:peroxidase-related enzyme [Bacteroidota bacterium]MCH8171335.1 peroxidase-related enzyme [Bacteroidota bacterium]MCH8941123.1 peroxidase-related enzyme [Bacteroidota bacterium]